MCEFFQNRPGAMSTDKRECTQHGQSVVTKMVHFDKEKLTGWGVHGSESSAFKDSNQQQSQQRAAPSRLQTTPCVPQCAESQRDRQQAASHARDMKKS